MKIGSLFTGYGGLDIAVASVTGGETVWVSDVDKGANKILAHRYPNVSNLGDITTVDFTKVERVDILTGGFPCQDLSHAGKRAGLKEGTRSGLWSHMARAIKQLQPKLVVVENVRGLLSADAPGDVEPCPWCVGDGPTVNLRALGVVLADLADLGFDAEWVGLRCADIGGCHGRFRVFLVAFPTENADRTVSRERWFTAPRQAAGGRSWSDPGGSDRTRTELTLLPTPAANDMGVNKTLEWWDDWTTKQQTKHNNSNGHGPSLGIEAQRATVDGDWGKYGPAIDHWENVLGREAPPPTEPVGKTQQPRLSPRFEEWMMGLPDGWVTDVPGLTRNESLKALGNGVVPQQAVTGLVHLLGRLS